MKEIYKNKVQSILKGLNHITFDFDDHSFILHKECNTKDGRVNVSKLIEKLRWDNDFWFNLKTQ